MLVLRIYRKSQRLSLFDRCQINDLERPCRVTMQSDVSKQVRHGVVGYLFLADRSNGRAIGTVLRLSVCLSLCDVMYCG